MNKDLNTIFKNLFKKRPKGMKGGSLFGRDPREDWKKLLIGFSLVALLIVAWSGYLFWEINKGDIFAVEPTQATGADTATRNQLKKILNVYDSREKNFEDLRLNKPVIGDPTI